jgi:MinD superfamily P-loop ATPase
VSFCPFGVYSVCRERVVVTAPRNCKDNCPACARVCPRQAIIFPKVAESPIDGADVTEADLEAARQRLAAREKAAASGDIHNILAQRKLRLKPRP